MPGLGVPGPGMSKERVGDNRFFIDLPFMRLFSNPLFVIASEVKQSQTESVIASSLTLLAMTIELLNDLRL